MADLEQIAEMLRRQKKDLDDLRETTASHRDETSELVDTIHDLQQRAEETQQRFRSSAAEARASRGKKK